MRILKYLFLLFLLSLVTLAIFVATQKGFFIVEKSKIINSPRNAVYNYVNELNNWGEWNSLAVEDTLITISISKNTTGNGSQLSWSGNQGDGKLQTISTKEFSTINQKMQFNGNSADVFINLKDTLGKTKITWIAKGEMGFLFKVLSVFKGGANKELGSIFEKSLFNLDKILDYEINTYSIKVQGVIDREETNYLAQTFNSEFSKIMRNSAIVIPKITKFCSENGIQISGKPFIIYHTYDKESKIAKVSICIPITKPIFISEGSDISSRKLKAFQTVKTILNGDYSHLDLALNRTIGYVKANTLNVDPEFSHIVVLTTGKSSVKSPSKWLTEICIPLQSKAIYIPKTIQKIPSAEENAATTNEENESSPETNTVIKTTPKTEVIISKNNGENKIPSQQKPIVKPVLKTSAKSSETTSKPNGEVKNGVQQKAVLKPSTKTPSKKIEVTPKSNEEREVPSEF